MSILIIELFHSCSQKYTTKVLVDVTSILHWMYSTMHGLIAFFTLFVTHSVCAVNHFGCLTFCCILLKYNFACYR